jgi:hypothetical protein
VDYLFRVPSRRTFDRRLSTTISPGDNKNRITAIMGGELFICDKIVVDPSIYCFNRQYSSYQG